MKKILFLVFPLLFSYALTGTTLPDNDQIKAIVLINGEAYLVDVTAKGNIITTYQKIENYFRTNESHNSLLTRLSNGAVSDDAKTIVFYEKETEPIKSYSIENNTPIITGNAQYIGFSPRRAILKDAAVNQVRKIAKGYEQGIILNIQVTSYHKDSYVSRALARNRAKAITDLLHAFGVPKSIIKSASPYGGKETKDNFVNVSF